MVIFAVGFWKPEDPTDALPNNKRWENKLFFFFKKKAKTLSTSKSTSCILLSLLIYLFLLMDFKFVKGNGLIK